MVRALTVLACPHTFPAMPDEEKGEPLPPPPSILSAPGGSRIIQPASTTLDTGIPTQPPATAPPATAEEVERIDLKRDARARPVEALLRDPLSEVNRKERRSLLGVSAIAILIGKTGLVPTKIENLGITFTEPGRAALLW